MTTYGSINDTTQQRRGRHIFDDIFKALKELAVLCDVEKGDIFDVIY